jgi:hypothetical protein
MLENQAFKNGDQINYLRGLSGWNLAQIIVRPRMAMIFLLKTSYCFFTKFAKIPLVSP